MAAAQGRRGGGDPDDPDNAMMAGRAGRGGGAPAARVTKTMGVNRFVWNVQHRSGLLAPPGAYQAKLTVDGQTFTQPFNLLIDPRLAAEGLTPADLREQFEHNTRVRELQEAVTQTIARLRQAQTAMKGSEPTGDRVKQLEAIASKLLTEPVRYGKPGLQQHVNYLAGMTSGADQKVGRDARERYAVLKKEFDAIRAELDKVTGGRISASGPASGRSPGLHMRRSLICAAFAAAARYDCLRGSSPYATVGQPSGAARGGLEVLDNPVPRGGHDLWVTGPGRALDRLQPSGDRRAQRVLRQSLERVRRINRAELDQADKLNYDLYVDLLQTAVEGLDFDNDAIPMRSVIPHNLAMPINQLEGIVTDIPRIISLSPAATILDYENRLKRLEGVPALVEQTIALLRAGMARGVTPPRVAIREVPAQVKAQIVDDPASSPLMAAFFNWPAAIGAGDRDRLTKQATALYGSHVKPAFAKLHEFLAGNYLPACRESTGADALPKGAAMYGTTSAGTRRPVFRRRRSTRSVCPK